MENPTVALSRRSTGPLPEAWAYYRELIGHLYLDRNMSLPRLIEYMRSEHGFQATTKMYKMRIAEWGLGKNITTKRLTNMIGQRRPRGSRPVGRTADKQKRQEYHHRLPKERQAEFLKDVLQPFKTETSGTGDLVPVSLSPPTAFLVSENYIYLLSTYVRGSSEAEHWARDELSGFKNEDHVPAWCISVASANTALRDGKDAEAWKCLQSFIRQSRRQLSRQDPLIFCFVYTSVLFFAKRRPDIADWLLRALWSVSETLPWAGSTHPLRLLLQLMLRLGAENIVIHASRILLAYINFIHETLGVAYPIVQDMLSDTIWRLLDHQLMSPEEVVNLGSRMIMTAELQNQDRNKDHLNLKMQLAGAYLKAKDYDRARDTVAEIMAVNSTDIRYRQMMTSVHMLASSIAEADGREKDAELSAMRAVVSSMETFGVYSDWAARSLEFYSKVMERAGETGKVQKALQNREKVMQQLCCEIERLGFAERELAVLDRV